MVCLSLQRRDFQRTRHTGAILKTIGAEELITNSEEEYIALIEKITLDPDFQKRIGVKIIDNEHLLYRNISSSCIRRFLQMWKIY